MARLREEKGMRGHNEKVREEGEGERDERGGEKDGGGELEGGRRLE